MSDFTVEKCNSNCSFSMTFKQQFKKEYLRNNKNNGTKNIRCFPQCSFDSGGEKFLHSEKSFCGQALKATVHYQV